jgi:hypothetical protein
MARNLTQLWDVIQGNALRITIDIDTVRPDGTFDLEASHSNSMVRGRGFGELTRDSVGDRIHFTITFDNDTQGDYSGTFDAQGFINGASFDVKHPQSKAGWRSSIPFPP